ncbi:hypothetical protein RYX36_031797 [Vicia faba]
MAWWARMLQLLTLKNKLSSWLYFTAILGVVLFVLNLIWIDDSTGFGDMMDFNSGKSKTFLVATVDKPKLHLYETGIMRISRHPQMVGKKVNYKIT